MVAPRTWLLAVGWLRSRTPSCVRVEHHRRAEARRGL